MEGTVITLLYVVYCHSRYSDGESAEEHPPSRAPKCSLYRSTNPKALVLTLAGNSLQGSHYNIMVPTTINKNLELITQKCK